MGYPGGTEVRHLFADDEHRLRALWVQSASERAEASVAGDYEAVRHHAAISVVSLGLAGHIASMDIPPTTEESSPSKTFGLSPTQLQALEMGRQLPDELVWPLNGYLLLQEQSLEAHV